MRRRSISRAPASTTPTTAARTARRAPRAARRGSPAIPPARPAPAARETTARRPARLRRRHRAPARAAAARPPRATDVRLAVAVLLAGTLAACGSGSTKTVDPPSVEQAIRTDITRQGGALQSITCPTGAKAKQGTTFDCTIALPDGSHAVAHVTMTSPEKFDFTTAKAS